MIVLGSGLYLWIKRRRAAGEDVMTRIEAAPPEGQLPQAQPGE